MRKASSSLCVFLSAIASAVLYLPLFLEASRQDAAAPIFLFGSRTLFSRCPLTQKECVRAFCFRPDGTNRPPLLSQTTAFFRRRRRRCRRRRLIPAFFLFSQTRIREVMIQGILATEMSEHGTHITKVDKLTNDFPSITLRVGRWASGDIGRGTDRSNPGPLLSPPQPGGSGGGKEPLGMSVSSTGPPSMPWGPRMGPRALLQVPGAEAAALGLVDSDRLAVASALLHAADLSSPGRPFATCKVWVLRLLEEFKFQAEQVRALVL